MKLKRKIAKLLSIGILLNNISFYSNASISNTEIPNRYETIEVEYITIDDSTEGELVEIEVFGNTIQDENDLSDIQSVGDLFVDEEGNPILDSQGREQYKIEILSTNPVVKIYEKGIKYTNFNTNLVTENDDSLIIQHSHLGELETTDSFTVNPNEKISVKIKNVGNHYNPSYALNMSINDNRVASVSEYIIRDELLNSDFYIFEYVNNSNSSISGKIKLNNYFGIYEITDIFISTLEINDISEYKENKTTILLPTQLQKVGNVADRLYWDNEKGRYVIEKNIGEFSSEWLLSQSNLGTTYHQGYAENYNNNEMKIGLTYTNEKMFRSFDILPVYNTLFSPINTFSEANGKKEGSYTRYSGMIRLWIDSERLKDLGVDFLKLPSYSEILSKQKLWLENNPTTFYYISNNLELIETNIISKLKIPTYDDKTYIYVESENGINPTLKVTVDRLPQIAKNAVEEAEADSTINNISLARMYINMLSESLYKDQLQEQLSNIFSTDITLDRKTSTANLDIYIKSENMLSLSLNTNSVTFEDYSGVEDTEMLEAINITINSSLPYQLNAYLPSEISNADKSETIPIDILNIKDASESEYKQFTNNIDKIILKDDCTKGNNNIHNIDLKLASNKAHKADIYKTVIKFEAEQK